MAPTPDLIPLFPLQVVLFPEMDLPLHIFEPRYREMIGRCLETGEEFGVILATDGGLAAAGCTAAILEVVRQYPDGRLDIATAGRRRFRVLETVEAFAYLEGRVTFLVDEREAEPALPPPERLRELYEEVLSLLGGQAPPGQNLGGDQLSFQIAEVLPLDLSYKQSLLELTSEGSRRQSLLQALEEFAGRLQRMKRMKTVAGGNGHGR